MAFELLYRECQPGEISLNLVVSALDIREGCGGQPSLVAQAATPRQPLAAPPRSKVVPRHSLLRTLQSVLLLSVNLINSVV